MKQQKMKNGEYFVNEDKKTIVFCVTCEGKEFYGKAKCAYCDDFKIQYGIKIAKMRAELAMLDEQVKSMSTTLELMKEMKSRVAEMGSNYISFNNRMFAQLLLEASNKLNYAKQRRISLRKKLNDALQEND